MPTFRRVALVAGSILAIFLFFCGDNNALKIQALELKLQENELNTESAINDFIVASSEKAQRLEKEIERLDEERKVMEISMHELRHLPDTTASLRDQLEFLVPYRKQRFPAYVWQTWKYDRESPNLEPTIKNFMNSWDERNPDFVHIVLNDADAEKLIGFLYKNIPKVIEAYKAMPNIILKADFFRYLILFAKGGVYSDADTELLKATPNWLPSWAKISEVGMVIGIEADADRPDWNDWYARRLQLCQWTIQAKPGHPLLRELIARITEKTLDKKKNNKLELSKEPARGSEILEWTGPGIWTDVAFDYMNEKSNEIIDYKFFTGRGDASQVGDIIILPITSFSPGVGHMGAKAITDPLAFVRHHFEGSWKHDDEKM